MRTIKHWAVAAMAAAALALAGCGGGGSTAGPTTPSPDPALGVAKMAAMTAYMAADMAADAAEMAADAQTANMSADEANYALARNAAMRARTAADMAQAASEAAAATDDTAEAQKQQGIAEDQQALAEAEQANAMKYAGMVGDAHQANLDEIQRQMDVADARTRAMASYMDADGDATKAEMQADEAETAAPGSPGAMAARDAATAARTAADAAKAAHDAIMDDMSKADADAQATEAATQAGMANSGYMTAKAENDDIQTTGSQIAENNRQAAVAAARKYGGAAADNAKESADEARSAANAAKSAYDDAKAEYMRAMSARTNSTEAKKHADAASAAYMAAKMAADDAHAAYMAAKAAVDGVMDDSSKADADAARDTAEEQETVAMGHMSTAMMKQTDAEGALNMAMMYADDHVVGLLVMANAEHITTAADPDANLDETELELIRKNVNAHIANVNTAVKTANDDSTAPSHGGGTVTDVSYPYWTSLGADGTIGGTDANADTGPGEGKPALTVTPTDGGGAIVLRHAGPGADADDPADDLVANFMQGPGLGDFVHEKYISGLTTPATGNDFNGQRVILFTDLKQGSMGRAPQTVSYFGEPVVQSRIATVDTANPVANTERDYNATYDHDGDAATAPIAVVLNCGTTCNLRVTNGDVVSISGYTFQTAGDVTVAGVAPVEDTTWLAFGIWLTEAEDNDATDADGDTINDYAFGAFAAGGDPTESTEAETVTGTATYRGKAAGVHSTATAVDFFHADATLTADFDAPDGATNTGGTITGMIENIMSGGRSVDDAIELVLSDPGAESPAPNITAAGVFNGRARMTNTGVQDDSGEDIYRMTGTWTGNFYNAMADDTTTTPLNEATRAPGSVAGTFGVGRADVATTMDADETESYVGAFGAHCSGSNCNPH